jgi:hypothetical protein
MSQRKSKRLLARSRKKNSLTSTIKKTRSPSFGSSKIAIRPDGKIEFLYKDDLRNLLNIGRAEISRASTVEPTSDNRWLVDLSPIGGPKLGPFKDRQKALDEEVRWVEKNYLQRAG